MSERLRPATQRFAIDVSSLAVHRGEYVTVTLWADSDHCVVVELHVSTDGTARVVYDRDLAPTLATFQEVYA